MKKNYAELFNEERQLNIELLEILNRVVDENIILRETLKETNEELEFYKDLLNRRI